MDPQGARAARDRDLELPVGARTGRDALKGRLRLLRQRIGDHPVLLPLIFLASPLGSSRAIDDRTDLVIEGFPRSGNTFARFAVLQAQPTPIQVSSHVHVPAQVQRAVTRGLPTLVIIREPLDAVASNLIYSPHVRPGQVLEEWIHYHRQVMRWRSGFEIASFDEVVTDLGSVTDRVNARFGTGLARFEHTPEAMATVFASIEAHHLHVHENDERTVPRPSSVRRLEQPEVHSRLLDPALATLVATAQEAYRSAIEG